MFRRCVVLVVMAALLVPLAGCGGSDSGSSGNSQAKPLLDSWSDTTLATLSTLQARARAFTARDKPAFDRATGDLQTQLQTIQQFPEQAQRVKGADATSVAADAAAWKAWADGSSKLLSKDKVSSSDLKGVSKLAAAALEAHLNAYKKIGAEVPADFKKQAGGS